MQEGMMDRYEEIKASYKALGGGFANLSVLRSRTSRKE